MCIVLYLDRRGSRASLRDCYYPAGTAAVPSSGCKCGYAGMLPSVCLLDGWHRRAVLAMMNSGTSALNSRQGLFQTGMLWCGVRRYPEHHPRPGLHFCIPAKHQGRCHCYHAFQTDCDGVFSWLSLSHPQKPLSRRTRKPSLSNNIFPARY